MENYPCRVFVYGTLKPGERYYTEYCADHVLTAQPAIVLGELFDLPLGYPAMTLGDRPIQGVLLTFTDTAILAELDELEGFDPTRPSHENEYQREQVEVLDLDHQFLENAWIYRMSMPQVLSLSGLRHNAVCWTGDAVLQDNR